MLPCVTLCLLNKSKNSKNPGTQRVKQCISVKGNIVSKGRLFNRNCLIPVYAERHFNAHLTLYRRYGRCKAVETTLCMYSVSVIVQLVYMEI